MKTGIVIDTETTGLLKPMAAENYMQPHCTEIYLAVFDFDSFKIIDELKTLIKPVDKFGTQVPLEEHIVKITKISDAMLSRAPTFQDVYKDISKFCKPHDYLLGQNTIFDFYILKHNFTRIRKTKRAPDFKRILCTMELSFPINNKFTRLGDLYELATGAPMANAHRAKDDALATLEVYKWLKREGFAWV